MRYTLPRIWAALALLVLATPHLATAGVPVYVDRGHDELRDLQRRVDRIVGPGRVNVRTDYLGARPTDPDPWFWLNPGHDIEVTLVDRKSPHFVVGWYAEQEALPLLDGVEDALLLDQTRPRGTCVAFSLPGNVSCFGFYVAPARNQGRSGTGTLWSNRRFNSQASVEGRSRGSEIEGDRQMLVYDISKWAGADSWLVACETSANGRKGGREDDLDGDRDDDDDDGDDDRDDADYADVVFILSGGNVTPTQKATFGSLKRLYR